MLARDLYRTNPDEIRAMLEVRRTDAPLDRLLEVDRDWRAVVVELDELRGEPQRRLQGGRRAVPGRPT